jgi:hypothetical protein
VRCCTTSFSNPSKSLFSIVLIIILCSRRSRSGE